MTTTEQPSEARTAPTLPGGPKILSTEIDLDDLASSWRPEVWKIAELAEIYKVHAAMAADAHIGKLVVTVGAGA